MNSQTNAPQRATLVLDQQDQIRFARILVLRSSLKLEIAGMKRHGRSAYSLLKDEGYRGTRAKVLAAVQADIDEVFKTRRIPDQWRG